MVRQRDRRRTADGGEKPKHKSVLELAREQGIGDEPADYVALATAVWPTLKDVDDFDEILKEIRRKGISSEVDD